ncbi:MAG: shikimate dehydrogenase [Novosphingobium sp.]|nr:shikimate dehydrogenase [Novosphingobium sp.]
MGRPYAEVIGDPIAHSKSPVIHNFWLEKLGIDAEYLACRVRPDELTEYFTRRRGDAEWRGCNVTIPHKTAILELVDDQRAVKEIGAANCVIRSDNKLVAFNTDTAGVSAALPRTHDSVCLIGAGGAARAAIPSIDLFAPDIRVLVRDPAKAARSLADLDYDLRFFQFSEAAVAMLAVGGVINASPLGMQDQPPLPTDVLAALSCTDPRAYVFDMVYAPLETELLKSAQMCGRETIDGLIMLVGQADLAFRQFFGCYPPREHDAELRALLAS